MSDKPERSKTNTQSEKPAPPQDGKPKDKEVGGRKGPEPTRYGDWERKGICVDF